MVYETSTRVLATDDPIAGSWMHAAYPSHRAPHVRQPALEDSHLLGIPWLRSSAQQMPAGQGLMLGVDANQLFDAMRGPLRSVLEGDMEPQDATEAMQTAVEGGH